MTRIETAMKVLEAGGAFLCSPGWNKSQPKYTLVDASRNRVQGVGEAALWEIISQRGLYAAEVGRRSLEYRLPRNEREAAQIIKKLY
jgi:hypothetical protein